MSKSNVKSVIVRGVSDVMAAAAIRSCPDAPEVDMQLAKQQHEDYVKVFRDKLGLNVIGVEADHGLADCVFVEDPLIAIEKKALFTTLGHPSRQPEKTAMLSAARKLGTLDISVMDKIDSDARMDGGDVLYTGQEILVGQSSRTNEAGIKVLSQLFANLPVTAIQVSDALHLKSVCSLAAPSTIIVGVGNEKAQTIVEEIKSKATGKYKYLEVNGLTCGANCVSFQCEKGSVLIHPPASVYPDTKEAYDSVDADFKFAVDTSEFAKVDGCLTCMSVLLIV